MSTRSWTHTLVWHRVDMSCLLGKQVKLPGTQDMFALFWISVGTLSMTLTQRWANMNWKCRFLHLFGHCLRNSIYRACPVSSIRWLVLDQCWSRVSDSGSVLDRYWYGVSCLLGLLFYITIITTCVIIKLYQYIFFAKLIILPLITCGHYCILC